MILNFQTTLQTPVRLLLVGRGSLIRAYSVRNPIVWVFIHYHLACTKKTISMFHTCEVQTEISVSRDTVWHHEALPSDAKTWPERQKFLSVPNNYDKYFFLHTIYLFISCNKMHTVCRFCHYTSQVDRYAQCARAYLIEPRQEKSIIAFEESNAYQICFGKQTGKER